MPPTSSHRALGWKLGHGEQMGSRTLDSISAPQLGTDMHTCRNHVLWRRLGSALSVGGGGPLIQGASEQRLPTCPPLSLAHPYWLSSQLCWLPAPTVTRHRPTMGRAWRTWGSVQSDPCSNTEKSGPRGRGWSPWRPVKRGTPRLADSAKQGSPVTHRTPQMLSKLWVLDGHSPLH